MWVTFMEATDQGTKQIRWISQWNSGNNSETLPDGWAKQSQEAVELDCLTLQPITRQTAVEDLLIQTRHKLLERQGVNKIGILPLKNEQSGQEATDHFGDKSLKIRSQTQAGTGGPSECHRVGLRKVLCSHYRERTLNFTGPVFREEQKQSISSSVFPHYLLCAGIIHEREQRTVTVKGQASQVPRKGWDWRLALKHLT